MLLKCLHVLDMEMQSQVLTAPKFSRSKLNPKSALLLFLLGEDLNNYLGLPGLLGFGGCFPPLLLEPLPSLVHALPVAAILAKQACCWHDGLELVDLPAWCMCDGLIMVGLPAWCMCDGLIMVGLPACMTA